MATAGFSEVMELTDGRVAARIYWGWFGTEMLINNAVHHADHPSMSKAALSACR